MRERQLICVKRRAIDRFRRRGLDGGKMCCGKRSTETRLAPLPMTRQAGPLPQKPRLEPPPAGLRVACWLIELSGVRTG
jgi:hypothetical protein